MLYRILLFIRRFNEGTIYRRVGTNSEAPWGLTTVEQSHVSGPEEVKEGALLTSLAGLISMVAGHPTGAVTFTGGT